MNRFKQKTIDTGYNKSTQTILKNPNACLQDWNWMRQQFLREYRPTIIMTFYFYYSKELVNLLDFKNSIKFINNWNLHINKKYEMKAFVEL